jgi:hypothetical protein
VGYFASTVGLDENMIKNYVRYQEQEDLGQAQGPVPIGVEMKKAYPLGEQKPGG